MMAKKNLPSRFDIKKIIFFGLIVLNLGFLYLFLSHGNNKNVSTAQFSEVSAISGNEDFPTLKEYFRKLAEKKGAPYAYEVLKRIPVKPNTDMHLMGHVVGEVLYMQKGADGMQYCTQDFRNACSHTIVVGLFSEMGVGALPEIMKACQKAPGGRGAYNMCFHGLGHGVLAFTGYDIPKTVELCAKTKNKTGAPRGREFPECVGGAVMEIISGGDHDKELWFAQHNKYFQSDDPLFPCDTDMIPEEAKEMCYVYLTPQLFTFAGAAAGLPVEEDYEKAFTYCAKLTDPKYREICMGGFGKEFVVLARARDIRNIEKMSDAELSTINRWCGLAKVEDGKNACLWSALSSLYWGGENDKALPIRYCTLMQTGDEKKNCFGRLTEMVGFYGKDDDYKRSYCSEIPDQYKEGCKAII